MSQLTYPLDAPVAFEGMAADTQPGSVRSYFNEDATEIGFGRVVVQGTGDNQCKKPTATSDNPVGITEFSNSYEPGPVDGGIVNKDSVNVKHFGTIWVICEDAFTPTSSVYWRAVASGSEKAGRFRASTDGSDMVLLRGARFENSGAAGALAKLNFDLRAHLAGVSAA